MAHLDLRINQGVCHDRGSIGCSEEPKRMALSSRAKLSSRECLSLRVNAMNKPFQILINRTTLRCCDDGRAESDSQNDILLCLVPPYPEVVAVNR